MTEKYSLKNLLKIIEPLQLGMLRDNSLLLYKSEDPFDPKLDLLVDSTAWSKIKGEDGVIRAFPTLENYYDFVWSELSFSPTQRVSAWLNRSTNTTADYIDLSKSTLFDYQQEAVNFLYSRDRAMLSLSPGLGKTLTSAFAAGKRSFDNVLVVCPASLLFYWKGELEKWSEKLPKKPSISIWHRQVHLTHISTVFNPQLWTITNPETVTKYLDYFLWDSKTVEFDLPTKFDCLIVDESIMYKHRDSQRSQALKDLAQSIPTTWLLTGAPATRYLDDMWHQFHILKPKGYASYWRFAKKYCIIDDDVWGSKIVANKPDAEKEIKKNFSDIYFSRTQDDVADIPDWIMEDIDIPMLSKQDKAYETLRKELYVQLDSVDPNEKITVNNHLSLMIRSVQVASNPYLLGGVNESGKWNALPDLMEIYPGPWLIWVNFIKTGELLRDNLSIQKKIWPTKTGTLNVALANGSTSMEDRNSMVNAFQNGEIDALILNNQVGKFGFTLTQARTAFFVERMYDDSYFQCLHRNRRIGTTQSPIIVNMRSVTATGKRTIDHLIHSTLDYRVGMIKKVTAGELRKVFE